MTHRILIVEDQPDIRKLIRMTLEFGDYDIHEVADGEAALRLAPQLAPHAVLLDVMMPGALDGIEVCRRLKQDAQLCRVPVIMLSARGMQADIAAGLHAGARDYLVKPFSPLDLMERLEAAIGDSDPATTPLPVAQLAARS